VPPKRGQSEISAAQRLLSAGTERQASKTVKRSHARRDVKRAPMGRLVAAVAAPRAAVAAPLDTSFDDLDREYDSVVVSRRSAHRRQDASVAGSKPRAHRAHGPKSRTAAA